ncbi:MAG: monofunctional biosynthetic peptidoglycan transglycosylase [Tannerellaceae bacterium]|nr:monofunctional biosynthetic peptidoglycan transglycosylase [Tannerellaceae bacterium]
MKFLRKIAKWIRNLILFFLVSSTGAVVLYKYVPVYITPLMVIRLAEQKKAGQPSRMEHTWIPLSQISPSLPQAVVASEDNLFPDHNGFDKEQIRKAREEAKKGIRVRGASTITQQTAKNVFLWPGKSYVRKGLEAWFTLLIEWIWGKERIMEVYLNSIEMGEGIYGAQAVAQLHFNKESRELTDREAALIAATLPNPIRYNSAKPSPYILKRQGQILSLMKKIAPVNMGYGTSKPEEKKP